MNREGKGEGTIERMDTAGIGLLENQGSVGNINGGKLS